MVMFPGGYVLVRILGAVVVFLRVGVVM